MKDPRPQPIFRRDYRPPDYRIDAVTLRFELGEEMTTVNATLSVVRNPASGAGPKPFILHGERLTLQEIELDGVPLGGTEYRIDDATLSIPSVPEAFTLRTVVTIRPSDNTELSGLYRSAGSFCTQCEAEGFRRITYFLDRPDVMARYTTEIVADATGYPVLLSNGNREASGVLPDGRHWVRWSDPFPKPSYLFALVAADLRCLKDVFTTRSGRRVRLEIWTEPRNIEACDHALRSLKRAMKWDEDVFGLEYDLDVYMIVAVNDFNMAAMENKGLNIFNAKFVLARPETATDEDYEQIEGVIAHEYFHNWTGNRVTCRDWFQLTLKEGLTVFRDELFTADMTSAAVKRVQDVSLLRTAQFAEDQSPTAHPIRPESYIEMNNFYTVTVYNKGAEVVRMLHTLLGADGFRRGMDLYFERHDGQAVTCDDFRKSMADANGADLEQFALWYSQVGTPIVEVRGEYQPDSETFTVHFHQHPPSNVPPRKYRALHIPISLGLVSDAGHDLPLTPAETDVEVRGTTALVQLRDMRRSVRFRGVPPRTTLSVLRDFSAPVKLRIERSLRELAFLMAADPNPFSRWDAAQGLCAALLLAMSVDASNGRSLELAPDFIEAFGRILAAPELDGSLKALTLQVPEERLLGQQQEIVDVDGLHAARCFTVQALAKAHEAMFWELYESLTSKDGYSLARSAIDRRRLRNLCLSYLVETRSDAAIATALHQLKTASNMTDAQAALRTLADVEHPAREEALTFFHDLWQGDPLVIDKWYAVQAMSKHPRTVQRVQELADDPSFNSTNPNRVRSLLGMFSKGNQVRFHSVDGGGYQLLADKVLHLDPINPQIAARLVSSFGPWRRFDPTRAALMKGHLQRIVNTPNLSRDVYELVSKSLSES